MKNQALKSFNILFLFGLLAVGSTSALAARQDKAFFDAARVQIEVFKDVESADGLSAGQFRQFVTARVDGQLTVAYVVSTGTPGSTKGSQLVKTNGLLVPNDFTDGTIETPVGYFALDKVTDTYVYHNNSGSTSTEPVGLYFFDPKAGPNKVAMHSFSPSGISGNRASHGCVRSPLKGISRVKELIETYGQSSSAIAVYGYTHGYSSKSQDELFKRPVGLSQAEIQTILNLI